MNKLIKHFVIILMLLETFSLNAKEMVKIPEITFSRIDSQGNCQNVTVSSFYIDKYDVTINEWAEYLTKSRELDSKWKPNYKFKDYSIEDQINSMKYYFSDSGFIPIETISIDMESPIWNLYFKDAICYCNFLSEQEGLEPCYEIIWDEFVPEKVIWNQDANGYRIPTVAEWQAVSELYTREPDYEYFHKSNVFNDKIEKSQEKKPNKYGVVDIIGNCGKFLWDYYYKEELYIPANVKNPTGPDKYTPDESAIFFNEPIYEVRLLSRYFDQNNNTIENYAQKNLEPYPIDLDVGATIRLCRNKE
ncbi:formylglycine-generating enzyme family protein [Treponema bryantii]|uniref:formylglycine-generating enzyme family protein n=1 Tax=Treponema bryantii TaxID=163 RepID=UPI002B293C18|nr:hypothetical protein TRBR_13170 [Treponema bryantii]